ncbi:MAG: ECF transporter S component [Negativicutes bacterium]|nr:ECF transporter S component [Negativicutes bacterium]
MTKTKWMSKCAIMAAVAAVLMFFDFSLPLFPVFLKFDLSEVPVMIAGFALGPWAAVTAELMKNIIHLPATTTMATGEAANFIVGISLAVPAAWLYSCRRTLPMAVIGMATGVVIMTVTGVLVNGLIIVPLYAKLLGLPLETVLAMARAANPYIANQRDLLLLCFAPFNLLKGVLVSLVTLVVYKRVSRVLGI